jgi:hypothetical protein
MRRLLLFVNLILSTLGFALPSEVKQVVREGHKSAGAALVRARLALKEDLSAAERIRLTLLKALLEAERGHFDQANISLVTARKLWTFTPDPRVRKNPTYLTEIEMTEFDIRSLEEQ